MTSVANSAINQRQKQTDRHTD